MGAIAGSFAAYAQPLFDTTDGSEAKLNLAMTVAQMCWNLALLPETEREKAIDEVKPTMKMTDEEFADFRQNILLPMIDRHHEMFPGLHNRPKQGFNLFDMLDVEPPPPKKFPGADRYGPCPCGSGRKYKFCCGASK